MKKKHLLLTPRFRHGSTSALLIAAFLCFLILINILCQTLEDEYGWWKDMSFNGYATTTEETREALSSLDKDVELYLLYQSGSIDENLHQVLKSYAVLNDHLILKLTDIAQNPGILTRFEGNETTGIEADTIIINCPETERYEVIGYQDFLTAGYNTETGEWELEGLAYEKNITEAIVNVSRDTMPVIAFLQGHGELEEEELETLLTLLKSNGYTTKMLNLLNGDSLDGVDLLFIASPIHDFSTGEVETLAAYAKEGGSFMVTRDYTDPFEGMSNYFSFLRNYGVIPLDGIAVAGQQDSGSYYENQIYLLPYMESLDFTLSLISGSMDILLMPASSAFETPTEGDTSLSTGTVLKTGSHAYLRNLSDGIDSIEQQAGDREGVLTLALYAHRMHSNGNISRMFACGSSLMFTEEYIYQRTYCEEFLNAVLDELVPSHTADLAIDASLAVRPGMTAGSQTRATLMICILPLLIIMLGVIILRTRYSK